MRLNRRKIARAVLSSTLGIVVVLVSCFRRKWRNATSEL
jgi:hypothetical protein